MWYSNWLAANQDAWNALPEDIRAVVERNAAKYALLQRRDNIALMDTLAQKLQEAGLAVNAVDRKSFQMRLGDFYVRWKGIFGETAWNLLERYTGKLG